MVCESIEGEASFTLTGNRERREQVSEIDFLLVFVCFKVKFRSFVKEGDTDYCH